MTTKIDKGEKVNKFLIFTIVIFCVLTIGTVIALNWQFTLNSDFGKFNKPQFDKVRGVITDFFVGIIALACALIVVAVFKVEVAQISMLMFMFQEITNFLCDNALRSIHLRYHFEHEIGYPEEVSILHNTEQQIWRLPTDNYTNCSARNQVIKDNTIIIAYDADHLNLEVGMKVQMTFDWRQIREFTDPNFETAAKGTVLQTVLQNSDGTKLECNKWIQLAGQKGIVEECEESSGQCQYKNELGRKFATVKFNIQPGNWDTTYRVPVCLLMLGYDDLRRLTKESPRFKVIATNPGVMTRIMLLSKCISSDNDDKTCTITNKESSKISAKNTNIQTPNNIDITTANAADIRSAITTNIQTEATDIQTQPTQTDIQTQPTQTDIQTQPTTEIDNFCSNNTDTVQFIKKHLPLKSILHGGVSQVVNPNKSVTAKTINLSPCGYNWLPIPGIYSKPSSEDGWTEIICKELHDKIKSHQSCFLQEEVDSIKSSCNITDLSFKHFIEVDFGFAKKWLSPHLGKVTTLKTGSNLAISQLRFYISNESVGSSSINTFKYLLQPDMVIKSAAVSLMTLFLLSTVERAVNKVITNDGKVKSRFWPLLGLFVANILGSTPINMVRFGWAYTTDEHSTTDKLSTNFVILLFLLLSAFYVGIPNKDDPFPNTIKIIMVLAGLCLLVIFDVISPILLGGRQFCPRTINFANKAENRSDTEYIKGKKKIARYVQYICLGIMCIVFILPIITQFYILFKTKKIDKIENTIFSPTAKSATTSSKHATTSSKSATTSSKHATPSSKPATPIAQPATTIAAKPIAKSQNIIPTVSATPITTLSKFDTETNKEYKIRLKDLLNKKTITLEAAKELWKVRNATQ